MIDEALIISFNHDARPSRTIGRSGDKAFKSFNAAVESAGNKRAADTIQARTAAGSCLLCPENLPVILSANAKDTLDSLCCLQ
jgi:hypothetical protein